MTLQEAISRALEKLMSLPEEEYISLKDKDSCEIANVLLEMGVFKGVHPNCNYLAADGFCNKCGFFEENQDDAKQEQVQQDKE